MSSSHNACPSYDTHPLISSVRNPWERYLSMYLSRLARLIPCIINNVSYQCHMSRLCGPFPISFQCFMPRSCPCSLFLFSVTSVEFSQKCISRSYTYETIMGSARKSPLYNIFINSSQITQ